MTTWTTVDLPPPCATADVPFGDLSAATVVVSPAEPGPGFWAGAPSALSVGDEIYLAYRLRRAVGQGRGYSNVVARSTDGLQFTTVATVSKELFGGDSLERPALIRTDDGRWRLYVSIATPGTKHWRVDLLEAATPQELAAATPRTVMPGDHRVAMKDPVIARHDGRWHAWVSCHPLDDPEATDRMTAEYATSDDGGSWTWHGTALAGRTGNWDARGVRVSAIRLDGPDPVAWYDGRATAEENWEERTGLATVESPGALTARGDAAVGVSPHGLGGLRYVTFVAMPDGGTRFYVEVTRPDGAHDLRTLLVRPPEHASVL